jgi:flagellar protein FliO/FliZ
MFHILKFPVYAMVEAKDPSILGMIGQLLSLIIMFLLIVAAAYLASRYVAKKGAVMAGNRNLKVIERMNLGVDKALYIICLGDCFYLIAVGKNTFQLIDKLEKQQIQLFQNGMTNGVSGKGFDTYLEKFMRKDKNDFNDIYDQFEEVNSADFIYSKMDLMSKLNKVKNRSEELNKKIDKDENDEI